MNVFTGPCITLYPESWGPLPTNAHSPEFWFRALGGQFQGRERNWLFRMGGLPWNFKGVVLWMPVRCAQRV